MPIPELRGTSAVVHSYLLSAESAGTVLFIPSAACGPPCCCPDARTMSSSISPDSHECTRRFSSSFLSHPLGWTSRRCSVPAPPPTAMRRPTSHHPRPKQQQQRVFLQCAQCGTDTEGYKGCSDHSRVSQKHGGQIIIPESIAQLLQLDRGAFVVCGTIRSRRSDRCKCCRADTSTRETLLWAISVDKQVIKEATTAAAASTKPADDPAPIPPSDPPDDTCMGGSVLSRRTFT